jgi:hypothetical protein
MLYLIITQQALFLSSKHYGSWRDIQDEFEDYQASLGAWTAEEMINFLCDEYGSDIPNIAAQVNDALKYDIYRLQCHAS